MSYNILHSEMWFVLNGILLVICGQGSSQTHRLYRLCNRDCTRSILRVPSMLYKMASKSFVKGEFTLIKQSYQYIPLKEVLFMTPLLRIETIQTLVLLEAQ